MRLCSLYSGSSGNCIYVGNDNTHILVDAGVSAKKVELGLNALDITGKDIDAILITHEHSDHIQGLGVMARKYGVPIYSTSKTIEAMKSYKYLGAVDDSLFNEIEPDESFLINDIEIEPNHTWHDAADPVCYCFRSGSNKISVATDLGNYDDYLLNKLKDSDILFIEANHDINMLQVGPYPYYLKQRILGNRGHLSNERAGQLIRSLLNNHIKGIALGHLSKENNYEQLAYETVKLELADNEYTNDARDFNLNVAKRDSISNIINV